MHDFLKNNSRLLRLVNAERHVTIFFIIILIFFPPYTQRWMRTNGIVLSQL